MKGTLVGTQVLNKQDQFCGKVIAGNFRLDELLGVGAMGSVYKAEQLSLRKTVCIKLLHKHLMGDATFAKRFQREALAASRIEHPNCISIIDFGQTDDELVYIAMEFVDGIDLAQLLHNKYPLETTRVIHIMKQVCSALEQAHAFGIIHRDLKPENIMVEQRRDERDFVKVLDFGIAKILDPSSERSDTFHTVAGLVCGTPEYMSPEQARGEALDARSDLYACGVILYQLMTNTLPFTAETAIGVVTKHLTEEALSPRTLTPSIHPLFEKLIKRLLSKKRDERPESAAALLVELGKIEVLTAKPMMTDRSSESEQLTVGDISSLRPRVWPWVVSPVVAVVIVVGALWLLKVGPFTTVSVEDAPGAAVAGQAHLDVTATSPTEAVVLSQRSLSADSMMEQSAIPSASVPEQAVALSEKPVATLLPVIAPADSTIIDKPPGKESKKPLKQPKSQVVAQKKETALAAEKEGDKDKDAGNYHVAIDHYHDALNAARSARVYKKLGYCYKQTGKSDQSRKYYELYLKALPPNIRAEEELVIRAIMPK